MSRDTKAFITFVGYSILVGTAVSFGWYGTAAGLVTYVLLLIMNAVKEEWL